MATDFDVITLRSGLTVPVAALRVLWALEDRGLDLQLDGEDIIIRPRGALTDADRATIVRLKPYLVALIAACDAVQ
jgi:hypothetical protein